MSETIPHENPYPNRDNPLVPAAPPPPRLPEVRKSPTAVLLTAAWHGGVLILFFAVIRAANASLLSRFCEYGVTLPMSTRFAVWISDLMARFGLLVLPAMVGLDIGACFLMNHLGGRRLCRWWSLIVVAGVIFAAVWLIVPSVLLWAKLHGQH